MKHLRLSLGLSQQQLADELNVSRSVIAMAETSKRPYPEDFLLKIDALEKSVMAQTSPEKTDDPLKQVYIRETIKKLENNIEATNYQLYTNRYKLDEAIGRLKKAEARKIIAQDTKRSAAGENIAETELPQARRDLSIRNARHKEAKEKMNIALLEMRITVLEFERELAEKWVKENDG